MSSSSRTPKRWVLGITATATIVVLVTLIGAGLNGALERITGGTDCIIRVGDQAVELSTTQAEDVARRVAETLARGQGRAAAARAEVVSLAGTARPKQQQRQDARLVARELSGHAPRALTCTHGGASTSEPDTLDALGLTGRATVVRRDLRTLFPGVRLGGFAPGGVRTGHMEGSAHYAGRAIDAFFRPATRANRVRGWACASYLVANADRLAINTVIFNAWIWTAARAEEGWRPYRIDTTGKDRRTAQILEHRDHVHVDVAD